MASNKKNRVKTKKMRTTVTDPHFSRGPNGQVILKTGKSKAPKPVSQKNGIDVKNNKQKRDKLGRFA